MNFYEYHNEPEELIFYSVKFSVKMEKKVELDKFWGRYFPRYINKDFNFLTSNAEASFVYAHSELEDSSFEKGEDAIATNAEYSYKYANHVLNGVFKKGENVMAKDPIYSYMYAKLLSKPFPEGEDAIAVHAIYAYNYAMDILNARFEQGEDAIKNKEGGKYWEPYQRFLQSIEDD